MPAIVVLVVLALFLIYGVALYNRLVRLRNAVRSSWSDIDVLLKKRYDLVDNLVETVKGYADHEKATLVGVTEARSRAAGAAGPREKAQAENMFKETLKSLFAVSESYPDLKADAGFLKLQRQLQELESGIEYARRDYNAAAQAFNNTAEVFPSAMIASWFRFGREPFFELAAVAERQPVKVKFNA